MSTTTEKKYKLISSDNETLVAMMSNTIKNLIEDDCADDIGIPVPNVTGSTLAKIIEYCNKHAAGSNKTAENLLDWDKEFMKIDLDTLYDLVMGANYLDMKSLLDLTCQTVADLIKGKTVEEIRKTFGIVNDFTPEQKQRFVRRMHGRLSELPKASAMSSFLWFY